jgi:peptide/nickel transport system substrate-binding protein
MTGSQFKRIGASALAVAALSLTACGGAASGGGSSASGGGASGSQALTIGYDSDPAPQGYDPLLYGAGQRLFYESLYQSLFIEAASGAVTPELVTSFSYNAKKTQMTLKLKSGVTFTDGSKLTAQLVKENLDRRSDAQLQSYGAFAKGGADQITNVTAPDASTVVLTFAAPQATFQTNLAGVPGMIVGQHGVTNPASLQTAPDGSGPYKLSSAVKGSSYTVTREPAAAAAAYPFATIVYKPFLDKQARANAQISGQTDVSMLDSSTVPMVQSNGVSVVKNGGTIQTLLIFDKTGVTAKPFGNKLVRLALSYAINRSAYVDAIAKGSVPTASAFPQASPGYDPTLNAAYAFSDAKAKQLLAQAGYPNGFSFTITASPTDEAQLEFIQKQFAAIGVTMNIAVTTSTDQLFAAINTQPMGFIPLAWASEIGITAGVLVGGFANPHRTQDPVIGAALGAASNATGSAYPAALKKLNDALVNEAWVIPVAEQYAYVGYNAKKVAKPSFPGLDEYPLLTSLRPAG